MEKSTPKHGLGGFFQAVDFLLGAFLQGETDPHRLIFRGAEFPEREQLEFLQIPESAGGRGDPADFFLLVVPECRILSGRLEVRDQPGFIADGAHF